MDRESTDAKLLSGPNVGLGLLPDKPDSIALLSFSACATERIGRCIGETISPGEAVLLSGEIGTGKTTLTRGIAKGIKCETEVRSPTFVLVNDHEGGRLRFSHCDLYRVNNPHETEDLAIDERLYSGAVAIEWPEMGGSYLPVDALQVSLDFGPHPEERRIRIQGKGKRSDALLGRVAVMLEVPVGTNST